MVVLVLVVAARIGRRAASARIFAASRPMGGSRKIIVRLSKFQNSPKPKQRCVMGGVSVLNQVPGWCVA